MDDCSVRQGWMPVPSARRLGLLAILGGALAGLLGGAPAWAWSHHALLTDQAIRALPAAERQPFEVRVPVESLESFLQEEAKPVGDFFLQFAQTVGARRPKRYRYLPFDPGAPTLAVFLRAARLNPGANFHLVERAIDERRRGKKSLSPAQLRAITGDSGLSSIEFYELSPGALQSVRSIVSTYVDEPDWGFDQSLWGHAEYGYGESPYGDLTGTSSQAPFHMLFLRENWIVRHFVSFLTEGMMEDRVELFRGLSRLAFERGHPYWGWRFLSWSLHYLQDLTQPYHAKAVPHVGLGYYLRFAVSSSETQARVKRETSQRVKNRHFALEDFASFVLLHPEKTAGADVLLSALARGHAIESFSEGEREKVSLLLERIAEASDRVSLSLDQAVVAAFGSQVCEDPRYDLEKDTQYSIQKSVLAMAPSARQGLIERVQERFESVGALTRQWLAGATRQAAKPEVRPDAAAKGLHVDSDALRPERSHPTTHVR